MQIEISYDELQMIKYGLQLQINEYKFMLKNGIINDEEFIHEIMILDRANEKVNKLLYDNARNRLNNMI
jgi:hypothetical protein